MVSHMKLENEKNAAINAVLKASDICESVQRGMIRDNTMQKEDKSPVTVADFAAQALIIGEILKQFPNDKFVAEEDSSSLMTDEGEKIRRKIFGYLSEYVPGLTEDNMINTIDRGNFAGGKEGRFWTLDPIDGTKGFIRHDQYAIALALIEEGKVVMGVMGCPSLYSFNEETKKRNGFIFHAVEGQGAYSRPIKEERVEQRISVSRISDVTDASFCESVESAHSSHEDAIKIAGMLGVNKDPIRIDSQCKYAVIARGEASIYLRLPTKSTYVENIWDHAAGCLIVEEAGGKVTDCHGERLDFSLGAKLKNNTGIVGTNGIIHEKVIEAVSKVIS